MLDVDMGTLSVYANGLCLGMLGLHMAQEGLAPPLRWAVSVYHGSEVEIEGPVPLVSGQPTFVPGGSLFDRAMPVGTALEVEGQRATYQGFKKKRIGANEHTILLDDGTTLAVKLKERSWRYVLPGSGKWPVLGQA